MEGEEKKNKKTDGLDKGDAYNHQSRSLKNQQLSSFFHGILSPTKDHDQGKSTDMTKTKTSSPSFLPV